MLDNIKKVLVGQVIKDAALVNVKGEKHIRLILSDSQEPLLVALDNAIVTAASRKPMARALTAAPIWGKVTLAG